MHAVSSQIEIKMRKEEGMQWSVLEGAEQSPTVKQPMAALGQLGNMFYKSNFYKSGTCVSWLNGITVSMNYAAVEKNVWLF